VGPSNGSRFAGSAPARTHTLFWAVVIHITMRKMNLHSLDRKPLPTGLRNCLPSWLKTLGPFTSRGRYGGNPCMALRGRPRACCLTTIHVPLAIGYLLSLGRNHCRNDADYRGDRASVLPIRCATLSELESGTGDGFGMLSVSFGLFLCYQTGSSTVFS